MKNKGLHKLLGGLTLGLAVVLPGQMAIAQEDVEAGKPCNLASVKGRYSFSEQGFIFPYYPDTTMRADFVEVGVFTLDGNGGGAGKADISINGGPIRNIPLMNIKYKINADCSGEASFAPGGDETQRRTIALAAAQKGSQIHFISVQPGAAVRGIAQKQ